MIWFLLSIVLQGTRRPVLYPYLGTCSITLVFDAAICSLFARQHPVRSAVQFVFVLLQICRLGALLFLLGVHAKARLAFTAPPFDEESASLLQHHPLPAERQDPSVKPAGTYGSLVVTDTSHPKPTDSEDSDSSEDDDQYSKEAKKRKRLVGERLQKDGNWLTYLRGFSLFVPMVWPTTRPTLYFNMLGCVVCILCIRVFKVLQPRQLGIIVNILASGSGSLYKGISLYVLYFWLSAVMEPIQACLWIPVDQYAEMRISTAAYNQIMELSSDFHDNKQSGELYRTISQGSSISSLLDTVCWRFGPMLLDLAVGYGYLYHLFGPYMALLAAATTIAYLSSALQLNSKLSKRRRKCQELSRKEHQAMYDSVGSWATVSYFNCIAYEKKRYADAVSLHLNAERLYYLIYYCYGNIGTSAVTFGFCGALCLAAYQVRQGTQDVGTFVILLTYWSIFSGLVLFTLIFMFRQS